MNGCNTAKITENNAFASFFLYAEISEYYNIFVTLVMYKFAVLFSSFSKGCAANTVIGENSPQSSNNNIDANTGTYKLVFVKMCFIND